MESPTTIQMLDLFIASFGIGAAVVTEIVIDRIRVRILLAFYFSALGAGLMAFGNSPSDPSPSAADAPVDAPFSLALIGNSTLLTFVIATRVTLDSAHVVF